MTTLRRTIGAGPVARRGSRRDYRVLVEGGGEPHLVRTDLAAPAPGSRRDGRVLACLAHVTDLQLADVQSPARFEFFNRELADPRFSSLVPTQRPQEALTVHAVDTMVRTLNALRAGPVSGAPIEVVVTTGDAIDNAQWNEMDMFLALLEGGTVHPGSGGPRYEGVQAPDWPGEDFWRPDGGADVFRTQYGFPTYPGLLERALRDFEAGGLDLPWLACFGNHEALTQGVGVLTGPLRDYLVGAAKPLGLPVGLDLNTALEMFINTPEDFLGGPQVAVTPDPRRRAISRADFVKAHFRDGARPHGHGFTRANLEDGTAYYVHDLPGLRLVCLDTNSVAGAAAGHLDRSQARWLEQRLAEVHSAYRAQDGTTVATGLDDRLVVLFSHHGLDTLTNDRMRGQVDLLGAADLLALLHRFPNVVLWLNGHTHVNAVRARANPELPGQGFWEVTTCAIVDWPSQARVVELVDYGDGTLSVACTMVDHEAPPGVRTGDPDWLASLHRELAANVPWAGWDSRMAGAVADRNVELVLRVPFGPERVSPR